MLYTSSFTYTLSSACATCRSPFETCTIVQRISAERKPTVVDIATLERSIRGEIGFNLKHSGCKKKGKIGFEKNPIYIFQVLFCTHCHQSLRDKHPPSNGFSLIYLFFSFNTGFLAENNANLWRGKFSDMV